MMLTYKLLPIVFLFFTNYMLAQEKAFEETQITINELIEGTLLTEEGSTPSKLAIIIAGSGPTDRNGNQNFMKNNSLKKLAEAITQESVATFRYDKRSVKLIKQGKIDNSNILFDDFVTDAKAVIAHFSQNYDNIYVIGHSQGSLIGMLAAKDQAAGFISLAGAGKSFDAVLLEQIEKTAPMFADASQKTLAVLKQGQTTKEYPLALVSLFDESLQPFMISWIKHNPQSIISTLNMPCLIINGTKDLQVSEAEAKLLDEAAQKSSLHLIKNMNHVLFTIEGGDLENAKSYNESSRTINPEMVAAISKFILDN
ncbi:alpha/beta hydrolase [Mangrovimonas yunxiaonensis]|nr:alpha/beta hydrolase [Mangrovimonas yunxiaonensis]